MSKIDNYFELEQWMYDRFNHIGRVLSSTKYVENDKTWVDISEREYHNPTFTKHGDLLRVTVECKLWDEDVIMKYYEIPKVLFESGSDHELLEWFKTEYAYNKAVKYLNYDNTVLDVIDQFDEKYINIKSIEDLREYVIRNSSLLYVKKLKEFLND